MATISKIEKEIRETEGFDVAIRPRESGAAAKRVPSYAERFVRMARQSFTVADWKRVRFEDEYPDLEVDVLDPSGKKVSPKTGLEKVRSRYLN